MFGGFRLLGVGGLNLLSGSALPPVRAGIFIWSFAHWRSIIVHEITFFDRWKPVLIIDCVYVRVHALVINTNPVAACLVLLQVDACTKYARTFYSTY